MAGMRSVFFSFFFFFFSWSVVRYLVLAGLVVRNEDRKLGPTTSQPTWESHYRLGYAQAVMCLFSYFFSFRHCIMWYEGMPTQ